MSFHCRSLSRRLRALNSYRRMLSTQNNTLPRSVIIQEVGPRDGLQNEKRIIPLETKLQLVELLTATGLSRIEVGSFVSPKWVPQMADSEEIFRHLQLRGLSSRAAYCALTPNLHGLESAIRCGVSEVAVFGAASEAFSMKNINCDIDTSLNRFQEVCKKAVLEGIKIRGYVSCVLGCPYSGFVPPAKVLHVTKRLLEMGCYEVSLGDTIGVGTPGSTKKLLETILKDVPANKLAVHFHDTYGQALTNIYVALEHGINIVDSSVSGLGGCPYATGASGNVATEDVVYMMNGLGIETNVDLDKLLIASKFIDEALARKSGSKVARALAPSLC